MSQKMLLGIKLDWWPKITPKLKKLILGNLSRILSVFKWMLKVHFLNDFIEEEVYVEQLPEFVDPTHPNFISNLKRPYMI